LLLRDKFAKLLEKFSKGLILKKFFRLSGMKIAFLLALAVLAIYYLDPDFLSLLELKTLDLRFLSRGKISPTGKIALVTIDEKSLDELGRWPWPRVRIAQLLDALVKCDGKVVGFDIVWAEPDEDSELKGLSAVRKKLKELSVKYTSEEAAKVGILIASYVEVNIPVIAKAGEGAGYFNIFPDRDGTVRWIPLVIQYQDKHYCALSLAMLQKFLDNSPLALRIAEFGVEQVRLGECSLKGEV
jgi:CHASE2 domain-containing sensor protein